MDKTTDRRDRVPISCSATGAGELELLIQSCSVPSSVWDCIGKIRPRYFRTIVPDQREHGWISPWTHQDRFNVAIETRESGRHPPRHRENTRNLKTASRWSREVEHPLGVSTDTYRDAIR